MVDVHAGNCGEIGMILEAGDGRLDGEFGSEGLAAALAAEGLVLFQEDRSAGLGSEGNPRLEGHGLLRASFEAKPALNAFFLGEKQARAVGEIGKSVGRTGAYARKAQSAKSIDQHFAKR